MKKMLAIILSLVFLISFSACSSNKTDSPPSIDTSSYDNYSDTSSTVEKSSTVSSKAESSTVSLKNDVVRAPTSTPSKPTHVHSFSSATCTAPKKCSCGATSGSALGHNYSNGKCSRCGTPSPKSWTSKDVQSLKSDVAKVKSSLEAASNYCSFDRYPQALNELRYAKLYMNSVLSFIRSKDTYTTVSGTLEEMALSVIEDIQTIDDEGITLQNADTYANRIVLMGTAATAKLGLSVLEAGILLLQAEYKI